jgi:hypothetical protein
MAFNWKAIRECNTPEESFYRLIGEMLHRTATPRDLIELRDFLLKYNPGPDAWTSLGEGLHCTTNGGDSGFRLWTAWSRSMRGPDFDLLEHARRWRTFGAGASSLEEETASEEDERPPELFDTDEEDFSRSDLSDTSLNTATDVFQVQRRTPENRGRGTRTGDLVRVGGAVAGQSTTSLRVLFPDKGPRAIKVFGRVFESVDVGDLLSLLRRGVLPAAEVEFEGRFIPILLHPDFEALAAALRDEAFRILGDSDAGSGHSGMLRHPPKP